MTASLTGQGATLARWIPAIACLTLAMLTTGAPAQTAGKAHALSLSGEFQGTHDPSIIKEGGTWYVFATGKTPGGGQFAVRCSKNLLAWKRCGQVFDVVPEWIHKDSPGTVDLWAPDISFYRGEYRLYYAYSLFGKNTSGIALATNDHNAPPTITTMTDKRGTMKYRLSGARAPYRPAHIAATTMT